MVIENDVMTVKPVFDGLNFFDLDGVDLHEVLIILHNQSDIKGSTILKYSFKTNHFNILQRTDEKWSFYHVYQTTSGWLNVTVVTENITVKSSFPSRDLKLKNATHVLFTTENPLLEFLIQTSSDLSLVFFVV